MGRARGRASREADRTYAGRHLAISESSRQNELVVKCAPGTLAFGEIGDRSCRRGLDFPDTMFYDLLLSNFDHRKHTDLPSA